MQPLRTAAVLAVSLGAPPAVAAETVTRETYHMSEVAEPERLAERIADFNRSLAQAGLPGQITSCSTLVHVTVGSSGNSSYGAVCDVSFERGRAGFLLCNDVVVGHFALTAVFAPGRKTVSDFTIRNCTGG